jgi:hypothetical protein
VRSDGRRLIGVSASPSGTAGADARLPWSRNFLSAVSIGRSFLTDKPSNSMEKPSLSTANALVFSRCFKLNISSI